jgi:hypothetical protein
MTLVSKASVGQDGTTLGQPPSCAASLQNASSYLASVSGHSGEEGVYQVRPYGTGRSCPGPV